MKEELIRIENGRVSAENGTYQFDLSVSRGECVGVYTDDHLTSGTAFLDLFKGRTRLKTGKVFAYGARIGLIELEDWIQQHGMVVDKQRFDTRELTALDFVVAMGKSTPYQQLMHAARRLDTPEAAHMRHEMQLDIPWSRKLTELSMSEYYRLAMFRAWFQKTELLVLDRFTEILRKRDLDACMHCVDLLREQGSAVLLADMDAEYLFRYTDRIDVIKNGKTCYRLYPEEYDDRIYDILGWERQNVTEHTDSLSENQVVLSVSGLTFPSLPPLQFQIRSGEIALLRDENYKTVSRMRSCFLGNEGWSSGSFCLNGRDYPYRDMKKLIGTRIGIQMERPNRPDGALFHNLTALDNLSLCLLPKAGQHVIRHEMTNSILQEASQWFPREELLRPLGTWSQQQCLRLAYYKWYLLNPSLLLCFFPFAGQETAYHEMIIDLLVTCARRGMAVWMISSGIDAICEKTENREFLRRLHDIGM